MSPSGPGCLPVEDIHHEADEGQRLLRIFPDDRVPTVTEIRTALRDGPEFMQSGSSCEAEVTVCGRRGAGLVQAAWAVTEESLARRRHTQARPGTLTSASSLVGGSRTLGQA